MWFRGLKFGRFDILQRSKVENVIRLNRRQRRRPPRQSWLTAMPRRRRHPRRTEWRRSWPCANTRQSSQVMSAVFVGIFLRKRFKSCSRDVEYYVQYISFVIWMDVASHCVVLNQISTVCIRVGSGSSVRKSYFGHHMSHRAYIEKNINMSVSVLQLYFSIKYHIS